MSVKEKHRPSSLELSKDKSKSDMIMRIVSPITPQFVNPDMRDTLKISEVIRLQQNELIASGNFEKGHSMDSPPGQTPVSNLSDASAKETKSGSETSNIPAPQLTSKKESLENHNYTTELPCSDTKSDTIEIDCDEDRGSDTGDHEHEEEAEEKVCDTSPLEDSGIDRIASSLSRKTLRRDNAPGPLRISPKKYGAGIAPMINSAPMRSLYAPNTVRRGPVRYIYPAIGHLPQTAVHYMSTPMRRNMAMGPERIFKPRSPRAVSTRKRKPVLDVFEGQVAKLAPMSSQPPSAQLEHFDVSHSDDEKATQEEMEEMELKRKQATSPLKGCISFNEESAFNFTIFQGNEGNAKNKFMEICETTWEKYMANSTGS